MIDYLTATAEEIIKDLPDISSYEDNTSDHNMAIEYLLENGQFDKVELLVKTLSDSRLVGEILFFENCPLEFFKKFIGYDFANRYNKKIYTNEEMLHDAILYGNFHIADYIRKEFETTLDNKIEYLLNNIYYDDNNATHILNYLINNKMIDINYFCKTKGEYLIELAFEACSYDDNSTLRLLISLGVDISVNNYSIIKDIVHCQGDAFKDTLVNLIIKLDKEKRG